MYLHSYLPHDLILLWVRPEQSRGTCSQWAIKMRRSVRWLISIRLVVISAINTAGIMRWMLGWETLNALIFRVRQTADSGGGGEICIKQILGRYGGKCPSKRFFLNTEGSRGLRASPCHIDGTPEPSTYSDRSGGKAHDTLRHTGEHNDQ